MTNSHSGVMLRWWAIALSGTAAALMFAWLGRLAGVPLATLLSIGAAVHRCRPGGPVVMILLVTLPWNLYFDARQVVAETAVSRGPGISILRTAGGAGTDDRVRHRLSPRMSSYRI